MIDNFFFLNEHFIGVYVSSKDNGFLLVISFHFISAFNGNASHKQ